MIDMRNSKDVVFGGVRQNGYLDIQNINRSVGEIEYHPLVPFLPSNAKVLFLGSFLRSENVGVLTSIIRISSMTIGVLRENCFIMTEIILLTCLPNVFN